MLRISTVFLLAAFTLSAADNPAPAQPSADPAPDSPSYTFRSDVQLARVDAQVVDQNNRPIRGLRPEDFILREDGKQQEVHKAESEDMPVDVLLLLDVSRSMEPHVERIASASHQALS